MLNHVFVSAIPDEIPAEGRIQPSHWNADHAFTGGESGALLYRDTALGNGSAWLADVAAGSVLTSGGIGQPPTWNAAPTLAGLTLSGPLQFSGATGAREIRSTLHLDILSEPAFAIRMGRPGLPYVQILESNLLLGANGNPGGGTQAIILKPGTPLTGLEVNTAGLYAAAVGGTAMVHVVDQAGNAGRVTPCMTKATTGDPASATDGILVINTVDKTIKMRADGAWRTLSTW